ncbi:MAG TPA: hypothetical protein VK524_29320 [Polyangiaceae bacterium]|nr:hypothetical protein [Polyangiaceae bacterium]
MASTTACGTTPVGGAGGQGGAPAGDASTAPVYEIGRYIGGFDRLSIVKRDRARDYCVAIALVSPGRAPVGLELPDAWGLEGVSAADSAEACPRAIGVPESTSVSGRIAWASVGTTGWPCSIDLDVTLTFTPGTHVPATDRLQAKGVGAPCER